MGVSPTPSFPPRDPHPENDKPSGEQAVDGGFTVAIPTADLGLDGIDAFVKLMAGGREFEFEAAESLEDLPDLVVGRLIDASELCR